MASTSKKVKSVKTLASVKNSALDHTKKDNGKNSPVAGRETTHKFLNITEDKDGHLVIKEMQPSTVKTNIKKPGFIYHRTLRIGGEEALVQDWYNSQESNASYDQLFANELLFYKGYEEGINEEIQANKDFNASKKRTATVYTPASEAAMMANILAWSEALSTLQENKSEKASASKAKGSSKKSKASKSKRATTKRGLDGLRDRYDAVIESGKYLKITEKFDATNATGLTQDTPPKTEKSANGGKVWHSPGFFVFSADPTVGRDQVIEVLKLVGFDDADIAEPQYEKIGMSKRKAPAKGKSGSRPTSPRGEPTDMSAFL